jgi:hypothetical protein
MKHKTWFRLVLKAIGIVLIGLSLPSVTPLASDGVGWLLAQVGVPWLDNGVFVYNLPYGIGGVMQFLLGLYLLLGGTWLLDRIIPSNRPYCPECGYDLSNNRSSNCPECGVLLPLESTSSNGNQT